MWPPKPFLWCDLFFKRLPFILLVKGISFFLFKGIFNQWANSMFAHFIFLKHKTFFKNHIFDETFIKIILLQEHMSLYNYTIFTI